MCGIGKFCVTHFDTCLMLSLLGFSLSCVRLDKLMFEFSTCKLHRNLEKIPF